MSMKRRGRRFATVIAVMCMLLFGLVSEALAAAVTITEQPASATVFVGDTATFKVTASGTGLKYQWQTLAPGTADWKNSSSASAKKATFTITAQAGHNGYKFRCVITDASGTKATSGAAKLTVKPKITGQPESITEAVGNTATFTVTATGKSTLKYQWQTKAPGAAEWKDSPAASAKKATFNIVVQAGHHGYQFRCIVTDGNGNKTTSGAATLTLPLTIKTQPKNTGAELGSAATFSVAAVGKSPLSYQWQTLAPNATVWKNSSAASAKTAKFSITTQIGHNGYQIRCIVTDGNSAQVTTDAVTLTVKPRIDTQPKSAAVAEGATASFTIAATGKGTLTYQWQMMAPNSLTWKSSTSASAKTAKLSVKVRTIHQGYQFRCIVTDENGNKSVSDVVKVTLRDIPVTADYFPDEIFRGYISKNFDKDKNGVLSATELQQAKHIEVNGMEIHDLSGLNFFTKLEYLDCGGTYVYDDEGYIAVDENHDPVIYVNYIESLDVSCNTELKYLNCDYNDLSTLDVRFNPKLETLRCSGSFEWNHGIREIDVSRNPMLKTLVCPANRMERIDVSKNTRLEELNCGCVRGYGLGGDYSNELETLDLSKNTALRILYCDGNSLSELDLSNNKALEVLYCDGCGVAELDLRNNKNLTELHYNLYVDAGWYMGGKLKRLNLNGCASLERLYLDGQNELGSLNVNQFEMLKELSWKGVEHLDVSNCRNLEVLDCSAAIIEGDTEENSGTYWLRDSLDVRNCTALKKLLCEGAKLHTLDLSNNTALEVLECSYAYLNTLDLSNNTELKYLGCIDNYLEKLDLSNNLKLIEVYCYSNRNLTSLKLGEHKVLTKLCCENCALTTLNVSKCVSLEELECGGNNLKSLDVRANTELIELYCYYNSLSALNLSKNTKLRGLFCYRNQISSLNVSNCPDLYFCIVDSDVTVIGAPEGLVEYY